MNFLKYLKFVCFYSHRFTSPIKTPSTIYHIQATDTRGHLVEFSKFKGKKILIVNTASLCGFTQQYAQLQAIHEQYHNRGLVIIACPCNDFSSQEPADNTSIQQFCEINFNVQFLILEKMNIIGNEAHPLYQWLTKKSNNGVLNSKVYWNFQKYLVDENGQLTGIVAPWIKPNCRKIRNWLATKN